MSNKGATAPDGNLGRRLIEQYVLVEKIGEGGMGAVYLADQPTMGRRAVVKLLHPALSRDPQVAARFNLEARAAAALNHPHIVTVYNYGAFADGVLYLAMEHLDGRDLERAIEESGRMSPTRAVHVARQICDALGEAHARGVVHRDLKPSNVMLVTRGRDDEFVKVLDFGIAKVRGVALTATGMIFGTPEYMSPEQLRGGALDGRSDLYALGVVLFEMLSGRLPFACETPEQCDGGAPRGAATDGGEVGARRGDAARARGAGGARCLAKDPAARPATAEELVGAAGGGDRAMRRRRRWAASDRIRRAHARARRRWARGAAARGAGRRHRRHAGAGGDRGGAGSAGRRRSTETHARRRFPRRDAAERPFYDADERAAVDDAATGALRRRKTPTASDDPRGLDELEHEFLSMRSSLSARDRRAALRAVYARIDASGGTATNARAKKHDCTYRAHTTARELTLSVGEAKIGRVRISGGRRRVALVQHSRRRARAAVRDRADHHRPQTRAARAAGRRSPTELPRALAPAASQLVAPNEVDMKIGERPEFLQCRAGGCLAEEAAFLEVDRLILPRLERAPDGGFTVGVSVYDAGQKKIMCRRRRSRAPPPELHDRLTAIVGKLRAELARPGRARGQRRSRPPRSASTGSPRARRRGRASSTAGDHVVALEVGRRARRARRQRRARRDGARRRRARGARAVAPPRCAASAQVGHARRRRRSPSAPARRSSPLDGRGTCTRTDGQRQCPDVYDTRTGGIVALAGGGALVVTSIVLFVVDRPRSR